MYARLFPLALRLALFVGFTAPGGCFNPDDRDLEDAADEGLTEGESDGDAPADSDEPGDQAPACTELDEPCTQNDQCCAFDPELPVGATACVVLAEAPACTSICLEADDCSSGCCVPLQGVAYGACVDASACGG